jgi:hypothetical protein
MSESLLASVMLVACAIIIAFCWLAYISRGGRAIKLNIKGLGIEVHVDAPGHHSQKKGIKNG